MLNRSFRLLVALIAAVTAVAAVAAQGGRFSTALDLLTHLAPFYLVAGALAGVAEALTARRRAVLISAAVGILGAAALIGPEVLRPAPPAPTPGDAGPRLTLVQFNAQRTNRDYAEIVDWIVAQHPDVVMIEEATPPLRDRLIQRTGWHVVGRATTVMIFSPHTLVGIGVRPPASKQGEPTWVNARMEGPWGPLPLLAVHAPWPTQDLPDRIRPILSFVVRALGRDDLIFAGDFNSTPWSFARRRQDEAFGMTRVTQALPTWSAGAGRVAAFPIDHIYIGRRWRLVSLERGRNLGSDHLPLRAVLAPVGPR